MHYIIRYSLCVLSIINCSYLQAGKTQSCCAKAQPPAIPVFSDNSTWMADMADIIGTLPINQIVLPGTHDSATSDISQRSRIVPNITNDPFLQYLIPIEKQIFSDKSMLRSIIAKWSKTQLRSIGEQLADGIRSLDLRLCFDDEEQVLRAYHGLYSTGIADMLEDLRSFAQQHRQEIIILNFGGFINMNGHHKQLIKRISSVLGTYLISKKMVSASSAVQDIWQTGKQIFCLYNQADQTVGNEYLWAQANYQDSVWPNTTDADVFKQKLTAAVSKRNLSKGKFFRIDAVFTPTIETIIEGEAQEVVHAILPGYEDPIDSLEEMADITNPTLVQLVANWQAQKILHKVNIISIDWYTNFDFLELIKNINRVRAIIASVKTK